MRTEARAGSIGEPLAAESGSSRLTPTIPLTRSDLIGRYLVVTILMAAGSAWDLWSKWSVFHELGVHGVKPVWKGSLLGIVVKFDLATTFNRGALWGIGQNQTWLFASLSLLAIGAIVYFLWTRQAITSWWLTVATGLLLAGTIGNLYDRLGLHGWKDEKGPVYAVRDFLDFVFFDGKFEWATFNFADVYLVTGAIMLVLQSFWAPSPERSQAK